MSWEVAISTQPSAAHRPSISIYQNPDHVSGILQQAHYAPLITTEQRDVAESESASSQSGRQGGARLKASASVPALGSIDANITGERTGTTATATAADKRLTRNYEYSQAYYLLEVRRALQKSAQLTTVRSKADAQGLAPGDFVEFEAPFRASELHALLDILTPDLIAAITFHHVRSEGLKLFTGYSSIDELKIFSEKNLGQAQAKADLARSVAEAVRVDFRSMKTREFYGSIGSGEDLVTAVTICDVPHFVVDDEDRILDGVFTVLGKVASPLREDLPVLNRNKVLDRLKPEGVDDLFAKLRDVVVDQAQTVGPTETGVPDDILDVAFASRIAGSSFNVIPIAIYI